jgi:hypothetical protein
VVLFCEGSEFPGSITGHNGTAASFFTNCTIVYFAVLQKSTQCRQRGGENPQLLEYLLGIIIALILLR